MSTPSERSRSPRFDSGRARVGGGPSDVDHDVTARPRAADEDVAVGRRVERFRVVGDAPGDQPALARVTERPFDGTSMPARRRLPPARADSDASRATSAPRGTCARRRREDRSPSHRSAHGVCAARRRRPPVSSHASPAKISVWIRPAGTCCAASPAVRSCRKPTRTAEIGNRRRAAPRARRAWPRRDVRPRRSPARARRRRTVCCSQTGSQLRQRARATTRCRASRAKAWLSRFFAPWSHQTSRWDAAAASEHSMASTGVAPIPALSSTTGPSPPRRTKPPRGALVSRTSPT